MAASLLLATAILFLRRPDVFLRPQLWAEDGPVFFKQALEEGASSLAVPYAGYHHLVPRLVALAATLFPPSAAPRIYMLASLACVLSVGAFLFSPRLRLPLRPLLVLALVMVPDAGETLLNLPTVHWILALLLPLIALQDPPRDRREAALDHALLLLVGLSSPYGIPCTVLFALRAAERRDAHSFGLLGTASAAALVQVLALGSQYGQGSFDGYGSGHSLGVLGVRLGGSLLLGVDLASRAPAWLAAGLTAGLVALLLFLLRGDRDRLRAAAVLLFLAATVLAAAIFKSSLRPVDLSRYENGSRHFYAAQVVLPWLAILGMDRGCLRAFAGGALLGAMATASVFGGGFRLPALHDLDWPSWARRIEAGERVVVPINPAGWSFEIRIPPRGG